jgi:ketosteroid isomerase-like protein
MKYYTILFIGFLSLISSFPLITRAQVSSPSVPEALTEEEVRLFIDDYTKRFTKMDFEAYMDLFSSEAVENRALPYADIRVAYRRTIQGSHSIQYDVKIYSIQTYARSAFASGRYQITQTLKGGGVKTFKGNIQWVLAREGRALKIKEINYGIDH